MVSPSVTFVTGTSVELDGGPRLEPDEQAVSIAATMIANVVLDGVRITAP